MKIIILMVVYFYFHVESQPLTYIRVYSLLKLVLLDLDIIDIFYSILKSTSWCIIQYDNITENISMSLKWSVLSVIYFLCGSPDLVLLIPLICFTISSDNLFAISLFYYFTILFTIQSVECALQALKATNTDMFYRKHAWQLIKCFLVSAVNLDDDKTTLSHLLVHHNFHDGPIQSLNTHNLYECTDPHIREVMQKAISAMFGRWNGVCGTQIKAKWTYVNWPLSMCL